MAISSVCIEFTSDLAYYLALTSNNEYRINQACRCIYEKYSDFKFKVLADLKLDARNDINRQDVEDAFQVAVTVMVSKIRAGEFVLGKSKISTYLFAVCKYQLLAMQKKKTMTDDIENTPEQKLKASAAINDMVATELEQQFADKMLLIKKAVTELRKGCADALHRLLYLNETPEQIALARATGIHTLRTEISRCKNELKAHLIDNYKFNQDGLWL